MGSAGPQSKSPCRSGISPPGSLAGLLGEFRSCSNAWTFPVFCALACGLVTQLGRQTVCGMLVGARLNGVWSHHRAHRFFSHARWSVDKLCTVLAALVVRLLADQDSPVLVAIDDTLFRRRGPKVHAASWFHDGSAKGERTVGYGNNWVILAIVVHLPFLERPVAIPVGFSLVVKAKGEPSRPEAACRLVEALGGALGERRIDVVADCAYAGKVLRTLPESVTWTTRLKPNAGLYERKPGRTGQRGRPREKSKKLEPLSVLADNQTFHSVDVRRYGKDQTVKVAVLHCLWYRVLGKQEVQVVFVRDKKKAGYDIALVSSDLSASPVALIERYAARWSIEIAIEDAKQLVGVGQARNRVKLAVERTVPFGLIVGSLAVCWYATAGHHPDDVDSVREVAPWYRGKTQPSVLDILAKLRRVVIAAQFRSTCPLPATPAEIDVLRLAWEDVAA